MSKLPGFLGALATNLLQTEPPSEEAIATILNWPKTLGCDQAITLQPDAIVLSEQLDLLQQQLITSVLGTDNTTDDTNKSSPLTVAASPEIAATYNSQGFPALWISTVESASFRLQGSLTLALPEITGIELQSLPPQKHSEQAVLTTLRSTLSDYGVQGGVLEFYGEAVAHLSTKQRLIICEALAREGYQGFFPAPPNAQETPPEDTALYSNTISLALPVTNETTPDDLKPTESRSEPATACRSEIDFTPLQKTISPETLLEPNTVALFPEKMSLQQIQASISAERTHTCAIAFGGITFGNGSLEAQEITSIQMRCKGIGAVVAESFSNHFRSQLIHNGILPLEFIGGDSWTALELTSKDKVTLDIPKEIYPYEPVVMTVHRDSGRRELVELTLRLDNKFEIEQGSQGGVIQQAFSEMNAEEQPLFLHDT